MISVGLGAAIGALTRYLITNYWKKFHIDWPFATLLINVTGSFILGLLTTHVAENSQMMYFLGIGMMGGYTTFSTFNTELVALIDEKRWTAILIYLTLSYILGITAGLIGMTI